MAVAVVVIGASQSTSFLPALFEPRTASPSRVRASDAGSPPVVRIPEAEDYSAPGVGFEYASGQF
jgi:hypothetical protein